MCSVEPPGLCVSQKIHWPHNVTSYLVRYYKMTPCLWDHAHQDYNDKQAKERALGQFSRETGYPVEAIRKKLINLRNQFTNEWQKMDRSRDSERPYRTKWAFYKSLTFLKDVVLPRKPRGPIHLDAARLMTSPREPQSIDLSGDLETVRDDCHPDAAMMATNDPDNEDLELSQSSTSLVLSPEVTLEEPSSSERRTLQIEDDGIPPDQRLSYSFPGERYNDLPRGDHIDSFTSYIGTELRRVPDEEAVGALKLHILKLIFDAQAASTGYGMPPPQ